MAMKSSYARVARGVKVTPYLRRLLRAVFAEGLSSQLRPAHHSLEE
jgi:hypothetical protein